MFGSDYCNTLVKLGYDQILVLISRRAFHFLTDWMTHWIYCTHGKYVFIRVVSNFTSENILLGNLILTHQARTQERLGLHRLDNDIASAMWCYRCTSVICLRDFNTESFKLSMLIRSLTLLLLYRMATTQKGRCVDNILYSSTFQSS